MRSTVSPPFPPKLQRFKPLEDSSFVMSGTPSPEAAAGELGRVEPVAFEDFFEAESPLLYARLCMVTGNRAEAEEIMQDAFLRLWERWDRVGGLDDPTGYLYRTAMNVFRRRYRRTQLAIRKAIRPEAAADEFAEAEIRTEVGAALAPLPPRQRAVLVLTELLGYSSEEAGRMLAIKPASVRSLATRARAALRFELSQEVPS